MNKIIMTQSIPGSAVQTNAALGEPRYNYGEAVVFFDKDNHPKGTPRDGKINVSCFTKGIGKVIARVDTEDQAKAAIQAASGCTVQVKGAKQDRRTDRAEARNS